MKKVIALLAVCGFALAFVACGKKGGDEAAAGDTTKVETPVTADTAQVDTAKTAVDTAAH